MSIKEEDENSKHERKWYNQLKLFKEHKLDKIALAAGERCKFCYDHAKHT